MTGVGLGVTTTATVVVLGAAGVVRAVVVVGPSSPPNRSEKSEPSGSSAPNCLFSSGAGAGARAARAPC
jgi:hypothetical protein